MWNFYMFKVHPADSRMSTSGHKLPLKVMYSSSSHQCTLSWQNSAWWKILSFLLIVSHAFLVHVKKAAKWSFFIRSLIKDENTGYDGWYHWTFRFCCLRRCVFHIVGNPNGICTSIHYCVSTGWLVRDAWVYNKRFFRTIRIWLPNLFPVVSIDDPYSSGDDAFEIKWSWR